MGISKEKLDQELINWKQRKKKEDMKYGLMSFIGVVVVLAIWQLSVSTGLVDSKMLPSPITVLDTLIFKINNTAPDGNILSVNIFASLQVALSGFFLAIIIGVPLGLIMGWWPLANRFLFPLFELIRPIPPIAWIPFVVVWLGIGLEAKALIIFFTAFVPCVINSYTGIMLTNQTLINVLKTFGAKNLYIFFTVGIPSSLPMIFAGVRVALGNAWSTLVAAEMLAAVAGLGYMIQYGRTIARPDLVIVGMVVIGIIGAILSFFLSKLENFFLKWKVNR